MIPDKQPKTLSDNPVVPFKSGIDSIVSMSRNRTTIWKVATKSFRRHWQLYLIMLPALLYFIVFRYVPMVNAVIKGLDDLGLARYLEINQKAYDTSK